MPRAEQIGMFADNPQYDAFVDKFQPKKTTDDCYTPEGVYSAVKDWVVQEYGLQGARIVRPFWPEGDYEREEYGENDVVIDNPPFSIITRIVKFYTARGIRFFLFAPTLTLFSGRSLDVCYLPCGVQITYENGAIVNTSFITNLDGEYRIRTAPDLYKKVEEADRQNRREGKKELPKYEYPDFVITAARAYQYGQRGVDFRVKKQECRKINALDAQKEQGKTIFGSGFLLNRKAAAEKAAAEKAAAEKAAAEKAAAEKAAAIYWPLSEREWAMVREMEDRP